MSATTTGLLSLDIGNFRNIERASLAFSHGLNLISGSNAAGKTSLLEAIYCLGRVRSFRTPDGNHLVREGQPAYQLVGRIGLAGERAIPIGMECCHGRYRIHIAGQNVQMLSELAGRFPVQIMAGDTANFLNGGPRYRRQSLDWALFHVEHGYRNVWQRYARALRQRNAALRAHAPSIQVIAWDRELVDAAERLDQLRRGYLVDLEPHIQNELESLLPGRTLTIRYISGWPNGIALHAAMKKTLDKDRAQGYSHCGPHRADIALLVDDMPVKAYFSRGQQKAITLALLMGQMKLQCALNAPRGAFLLDDLGSELDEEYQLRILSCLQEIGTQIFVTVIDTHTINLAAWSAIKRFHVEHGVIHEVL